MENTTSYTKSRLVKELAFTAGISQVKTRLLLGALQKIITRETVNAPFILPGICKFDTIVRKERRMRNPRTGAALIVPEHKVMRLIPAKAIRDVIAPRVATIKAPIEEQAPSIPTPSETATQQATIHEITLPPPPSVPMAPMPLPAAPQAQPQPETPTPTPAVEEVSGFILPGVEPQAPKQESPAPEPMPAVEPTPAPKPVSAPEPAAESAAQGAELPDITFHCTRCGQEIEAPGDMAGMDAECPMCGETLHIPTANGAIPAKAAKQVISANEAEAIDPSALKNKTIRIDATELGFEPDTRPPAVPVSADNSGMISFFCPGCHQEIEATMDMAGTISECPNCGTEFEVPFFSEKGTIHAEKEELFDPRKVENQKHKTMRIDLDDF